MYMLCWDSCEIRACCLSITEENLPPFKSYRRSDLLSPQFVGVISSNSSVLSLIIVYGTGNLGKDWQSIFVREKAWKTCWSYHDHGNHTMTMVQIMENMVIIPWLCHESWWHAKKTWPPCRHHGMIMAMSRHDQNMIMANSWHGCHVIPNRAIQLLNAAIAKPNHAVFENFFGFTWTCLSKDNEKSQKNSLNHPRRITEPTGQRVYETFLLYNFILYVSHRLKEVSLFNKKPHIISGSWIRIKNRAYSGQMSE